MFRLIITAAAALVVCALVSACAATVETANGADTAVSAPAYESRFFDAAGARLHYLDFGGAGLPIVFTAGSRPAETWAGFASRFTDGHRVLAITDRGVPPSGGEESNFVRRAGDILALLDTLGIERAVLVANSNPAQILIYLAEHHPDRVAGLVFLAPDSEAGLESVGDPSGAMLMVERALLSAQDRDPDDAGNWVEEDLYRPRYLATDTVTIAVPALTFVNMEGTRGLERSYYPLEVAELVASGDLEIPDSTARTYFERLAADEAMQAEVRAAWDDTFAPVFRANEQAFFRAFGDHLRTVRLDVPPMNGVPVVTGYEYLTAPELIEAHVRSFLEEVARSDALSSVARPAAYETKFVEAGEIRLQYHDFGGSGLPVIFVQDFHDYFGAASDPSWPPFLARFADGFRVLAPVRRGWGESDDTGYGYDVATQAEDLLAFMDALGIEQAVLVGRTPADHDMTWIAEHHPERLAGLIYLQTIHLVADYGNPLIRAFTEAYSASSCDMRDPIAQVGARTPWRPHFLRDESARIDVRALRFFWPVFDEVSMNLRRLDRVAAMAASPPECVQEKEKQYFVALAADEARQAELRRALLETDLLEALDRAMQRAFGDNLRTIRPPEFEDLQAEFDFMYRHARSFLEEIE